MNQLIEKHYREHAFKLVKSLTRVLGHHNAEDVVQEAYYRLLRHGKSPEDVNKYFNIILRNCIKDLRREAHDRGTGNREVEAYLSALNDTEISPEDHSLSMKKAEEISILIEEYPYKQRQVLKMFFIEQRGYQEIVTLADNVSYNYVRKIVSDFRKGLKS